MNFDHEELTLMMLYNTGTRMGLVHELRLMQCYLMPDETALRELSEGVIEKLKLLTRYYIFNCLCVNQPLGHSDKELFQFISGRNCRNVSCYRNSLSPKSRKK